MIYAAGNAQANYFFLPKTLKGFSEAEFTRGTMLGAERSILHVFLNLTHPLLLFAFLLKYQLVKRNLWKRTIWPEQISHFGKPYVSRGSYKTQVYILTWASAVGKLLIFICYKHYTVTELWPILSIVK